MASAQRLFRERGYKATTIRDIATEARVSVGSVMAVGDKAHLLVAMFDRSIEQIHVGRTIEGVPHATAGPDSAPADRLLEVIAPFLELFAADPELSREYRAILTSGNHESTLFNGLADDLIHEFSVVLRESGMKSEDVPVAAKTTYLAYVGALRSTTAKGIDDVSQTLPDLQAVFTYIATPRG